MFTVTKTNDERIELSISGKIDSDEMTKGMDDLFALSDGFKDGQMLYRVTDIEMPTLGAFGVELHRIPKMFSLVTRFDRIAVICDQSWVRTGAEIEGIMIPGITIKGFVSADEAKAEAWLTASA